MGYSSGHAVVDTVGELNITGNVIPPVWFKTIVGETGRPNMLACLILSDVVYWYRPSEVRDEVTGEFIGYKKKFRKDLLQRSYEDFANLFNVSKRQVKDAIILLEKMGVIKRVFRTITGAFGRKFNNVMFISLDASCLKKLTYPEENQAADNEQGRDGGYDENTSLPSDKNTYRPSDKILSEGVPEFCQTNTKITTETTNHVSNSIHPSICPGDSERDRFKAMFKDQIRYDALKEDFGKDGWEDAWQKIGVLDTCVEVATSVYFSTGRYRIIAGEKRPVAVIKSMIKKLSVAHMLHVVEGFMGVSEPIRNVRAYLLTSMINVLYTLRAQNVNEIKVMESG